MAAGQWRQRSLALRGTSGGMQVSYFFLFFPIFNFKPNCIYFYAGSSLPQAIHGGSSVAFGNTFLVLWFLCIKLISMYYCSPSQVVGGKKQGSGNLENLYRFEPSNYSWVLLADNLTKVGRSMAAIPVMAEWFP